MDRVAATIACPRCRAANSTANAFCSNCGVPLMGSTPPVMSPPPAPTMWPPPPPASTSNVTVLVVVLVIVIGVVLAGVAALLIGQQISNSLPPGTGNPRFIGISLTRSADRTNWSLLFTSVSSGETPSGVRLAIMTIAGATALTATAFASLNYAVHRAAYFQAQPGGNVAVGDRLLISTTTYPTGYTYEISDATAVLATGVLA